MFHKATRSLVYLKAAITGPSGAGKTFSALRLAQGLVKDTGKKIALIDTENRSASLYADKFEFDTVFIDRPYTEDKFIASVLEAERLEYGVCIIDSGSHFWEGILEYKAKLDSRPGSNSYTNWNDAGRKFSGILDAILKSKMHVIVCLRSKMDYYLQTDEKGKVKPVKVGMAPIMRNEIEYEFTTVFDLDLTHQASASKDRSGLFKDNIFQITEETGKSIYDWLMTAKPEPVIPQQPNASQENNLYGVYIESITPVPNNAEWQVITTKTGVRIYSKEQSLIAYIATLQDKPVDFVCRLQKEKLIAVSAKEAEPTLE